MTLPQKPPLYVRRPVLAGLIRQLPLLAVRSRSVDVVLLAATGLALVVLTLTR